MNMNDVITVEDTQMQVREYSGQRVVTFKDIDTVHNRRPGTAKKVLIVTRSILSKMKTFLW